MIIDASIVVALALQELSCPWIAKVIADRRERLRISWINVTEAGIILQRENVLAGQVLESLLHRSGMEPLDIDWHIARAAMDAGRRFPLHFGDCFAYAHASVRDETLLTLDSDFLKTDLSDVLHPSRVT